MNAPYRAATERDVETIATTLTAAFHDDPVFRLLFGDTIPPDRAKRFFALMATVQLRHDLVLQTPGGESAAIWTPPDAWKLPVADILRNGPKLAALFRHRVFGNLKLLNTLERHHPHEPHYYLEFLGTRPDQQGKGFGAAVVAPVLERADDEGVGAYLESSKESNLSFYGRLGFEVTTVIHHRGNVPQWLMWRRPR